MSDLKTKFGMRLKEIRKSKNLTQEKLAEITNMDIPNLSNIERGKKFVSSTTLEKLANALEVKEKEFFEFDHIQDKKKLINNITLLINESNLSELEFIYKNIINLKQYKFKNI